MENQPENVDNERMAAFLAEVGELARKYNMHSYVCFATVAEKDEKKLEFEGAGVEGGCKDCSALAIATCIQRMSAGERLNIAMALASIAMKEMGIKAPANFEESLAALQTNDRRKVN